MDLSNQRIEYDVEGIDVSSLLEDPFAQFAAWFDDALKSGEPEPYAMVLSTVDVEGQPRGRTVLLRGVDPNGFVFFTNYTSDKGRALDGTGVAALTFHWVGLHRQVHIEGAVVRTSPDESDVYFAKRPRESQLGAWASDQSAEIDDRSVLLERLAEATARFEGSDVERPDFWGGYRVVPHRIEFWQGQPSRLHDRISYSPAGSGWRRIVLSP